MVDVGAVKRNWDLVKSMGKSQSLQNFSDDKFHAKNDVKENWSLTKNIDLTLNATALILIKYIKVNVLHTASNCYVAQTSSTLYWGTVTICNPSTEKNHPVCLKPDICISNHLEMAKKRKSLLILGKVKMNDVLNAKISFRELYHHFCHSQYRFFNISVCFTMLRCKHKNQAF